MEIRVARREASIALMFFAPVPRALVDVWQANGVFAVRTHDGGGIKVRWRNIRIEQP